MIVGEDEGKGKGTDFDVSGRMSTLYFARIYGNDMSGSEISGFSAWYQQDTRR